MNSLEASPLASRIRQSGFTLVEVLLVLGLTFTIAAFSYPLVHSTFRSHVVQSATGRLVTALRKAELQATLESEGAYHGVRILPEEYVVFVGDSYDERDTERDESFTRSSTVHITGSEEVVFAPHTGVPNEQVLITLSFDTELKEVSISPIGFITAP